MRFVEADSSNVGKPARRNYYWATLAFLLALLSKPSAVALPLVAGVLDLFWFGRPVRKIISALGSWLLVAVALVLVTKHLQADERLAYVPPLWARPFIAGDALAFYLYKLAVPTRLGFDYGRSPASVMASPWVYVAWIVPCGLLALSCFSRHRRAAWAAAGVFVAPLFPTLGFIPFFYQAISTVADRYMYLPMLGVALALASWMARHGTYPMFVACGLVLGTLARVSCLQGSFWVDDATVFSHGLDINPQSYVSEYSLGNMFEKQGELDEARVHYERALRINPEYAPAHNDLGAALSLEGELDEAIARYREALRLRPNFREARANLANALARQGQQLLEANRDAAAERAFQEALRHDPKLAQAHNNLGGLYWRQGRLADADREYRVALEIDPQLAEARFNQGCMLIEQGHVVQGVACLQQAVQSVPADSPEAAYIRRELQKHAPAADASRR